MKLGDCKIGVVVQMEDKPELIGHVVGFAKNALNEVVPLVQFAGDDKPEIVHRLNLVELQSL